ncbi:hypothetical protein C8T65DRAFT_661262 [Cerioporus squamosus]|nr:hypothetical protein C8T65DRAFT_661262 [Cerioporus squamosus]
MATAVSQSAVVRFGELVAPRTRRMCDFAAWDSVLRAAPCQESCCSISCWRNDSRQGDECRSLSAKRTSRVQVY